MCYEKPEGYLTVDVWQMGMLGAQAELENE